MSNQNIPKPIFVIGDVFSSSYTTAMSIFKSSSSPNEKEDEFVLLCGTNDGHINLWSLLTYRSIAHIDTNKLTGLSSGRDTTRIAGIFTLPSAHSSQTRILFQFKASPICVLDLDADSKSTIAYQKKSFSTTFSHCFRLFDNCIAYLSESDSSIIQLFNTDRNIRLCSVKLHEMNAPDESKHGMIMSVHLFVVDILSLSENQQEQQALMILVAYESGMLALYRASLDERLEVLNERRMRDSGLYYNALQMCTYPSHNEMITCMDFNATTMRGITCSVDNEIALWSVNLPEKVITSEDDDDERRRKISELMQANKLGIWEHKTKRIKLTNAGILCCAIRPDGRIFATGGKDGRVRVFSLKTAKPLAILPLHTNSIECVHFTTNLTRGKSDKKKHLLLASSRDKSISIWSLYNDD